MIILEFIAQIFVEFIFQGLILGTIRFVKKAFRSIIKLITGNKRELKEQIDPIKKLEIEILFKEIELTENINPKLNSGMKGLILEILDEKSVLAEFFDEKENQIEYLGELVFELKTNQFKVRN